MKNPNCPVCGGAMEARALEGQTVYACPACAARQGIASAEKKPSALQEKLAKERKPKVKYAIIQEALKANPDDFDANRALLYHGRLHEPMRGRGLDFSIVKCHLLSIFHTPEKYSAREMAEKAEELLRGEQLQKTMALSGDGEAFFAEYIEKLSAEYVDMFIRSDSRYANMAFGFARSKDSLAKTCAEPVRRMLENIRESALLDENQRMLLLRAVRQGYTSLFPGYAGSL